MGVFDKDKKVREEAKEEGDTERRGRRGAQRSTGRGRLGGGGRQRRKLDKEARRGRGKEEGNRRIRRKRRRRGEEGEK